MFAVPRLVEVELLVQLVLLNERQDGDPPTQERLALLAENYCRRHVPVFFLELVEGGAELPQAAKISLGSPLGSPGGLVSSDGGVGVLLGSLQPTVNRPATSKQAGTILMRDSSRIPFLD